MEIKGKFEKNGNNYYCSVSISVIFTSLLIPSIHSCTQTLESKSTDGAAHGHRGVAVGVALVVDVLHALLHARTANATPFLLLIGPPSKDKDIVVNLAVSYLGESRSGMCV